ncbi:hypothetical protein [Dyella lutea]|uniref:Uncharacterized protein n=1 Tax=Dyella lutea TaxID=2950441 RepID=A0ABT1FIL0_9GAMM|nr:hypothetical protein [Dyella lutea]MCP1376022.1 hypothetical protein [Dyella lutea]
MHVGKLMARLNAKTVRFDTGSGGTIELTPQDIAGALAFVPDGLGRELLCRTWWPDGAALTERQLRDRLLSMIREEWARRESAMLDGMLAVAMGGSRGREKYATAHANRWPAMMRIESGLPMADDRYFRLRDAVIDEACGRHLCPGCSGRGSVIGGDGVHRHCTTCNGDASAKVSERQRAEACGISQATFRQCGWDRVYTWAIDRCAAAYQEAYDAMREAVR